MSHSRFIFLMVASLTTLSAPVKAGYDIQLTLNPETYTATAGSQITLAGSFSTPDPFSFTYQDDLLFGLSSQSPHLGIVAGSITLSQNLNPPIGGAYFEDEFTGGGYLGPTVVNGPATTANSLLRTFIIPAGTQPGTYYYSYGVDLFPTESQTGSILFDRSLVINVVSPEPSPLCLMAVGAGLLIIKLRYKNAVSS